ncbi:putative protein kinase RLK-Pelle-SD-2b family [Rosa chinensis]|uniref:Protein kinase domain-containing protein n=1 Tax=Rosa chinensis TaxID=74649 RepID=A0A2P6SKJ5_ROSCH|nr:putative protein kinase RLK-Pelle-SD-2b family [Rosa chinensis]
MDLQNLASHGTRSAESPPHQGYRHYQRKRNAPQSPEDTSEDNNFLEKLIGMPIRYSYKDLKTATKNFSNKIGQGGFGSVYLGVLPDGTRLAVKKTEANIDWKKEFQAEVTISGSIHHLHLARLRGFCAKGSNRLLAYEYMANGSLDKWIFRKKNEEFVLDSETRFTIAVGIAKGLAYLHEDCDLNIIHCDIKPHNVLLDDNYHAKVSDFGLAVLMAREQSSLWNIILLLEIISGRKNLDLDDERYLPSYASKMFEEGKLQDIFDPKMRIDDVDERVSTAVMVALWCIQLDVTLRPPMTKVVQMLQGICSVPQPPIPRLYPNELPKRGTSSRPSEYRTATAMPLLQISPNPTDLN